MYEIRIWKIGGIIMRGKKIRSTQTQTCLNATFITTNPTCTEPVSNRVSEIRASSKKKTTNCSVIPEIFRKFMDLQVSSPCSQQPTSGPYLQPDKSNAHPRILFKMRSILHFRQRLLLLLVLFL